MMIHFNQWCASFLSIPKPFKGILPFNKIYFYINYIYHIFQALIHLVRHDGVIYPTGLNFTFTPIPTPTPIEETENHGMVGL